jgi:hypothetical protein
MLAALVFCALALPCVCGQHIVSPFDQSYKITNLGSVGELSYYGGLAFSSADTLLLGVYNTYTEAAIYAVPVKRDAAGHINGFGTPNSLFASTPNAYGGYSFYGPTGVLLYVLFDRATATAQLGEIKSGSTTPPDKLADLSKVLPQSDNQLLSVGVVPAGFPGAGTVKGSSYGHFYDLALSPDDAGTYNVTSAMQGADVAAVGFAYLKAGSPLIYADSMFVSSSNTIGIYNLTANGDPDPAQHSYFVFGGGSYGEVVIDPVTNDLLFVVDANTIYLVTGFAPPAPTQGSE